MPHFDIVRKSCPEKSFRVETVLGTYDLQSEHITEHFVGDIDLPLNWNIGLIVGRSGSGKSTIAKELFGKYIVDKFEYVHSSFLDDMPKDVSMRDITKTLNSVGFSSPTSWLKPYSVLSNGEKMRCDIARAMLECKEMFCFDEFTSVVDRNVAQISSFALQKAIRRANKKFIAITCHYDVQEWLMPDWIFNTDTMTFSLQNTETQKKNRPAINLEIREIKKEKQQIWRAFAKYHYLSYKFNPAARTFVCYCNDSLAGFFSALHFAHPKVKNCLRGHRIVVFPDYQGVGIGKYMQNAIAEYLKTNGKTYIVTTSNPSMIASCISDNKWKLKRKSRASSGSGSIQNKYKRGSTSCSRITCAFEYLGEKPTKTPLAKSNWKDV